MQLLNLYIALVHSHTLPAQQPTAAVPSPSPQFHLQEWEVTAEEHHGRQDFHEMHDWKRHMLAWRSWQQGGRLPVAGIQARRCGREGSGRRARWRGNRRPGRASAGESGGRWRERLPALMAGGSRRVGAIRQWGNDHAGLGASLHRALLHLVSAVYSLYAVDGSRGEPAAGARAWTGGRRRGRAPGREAGGRGRLSGRQAGGEGARLDGRPAARAVVVSSTDLP
jgi:hypothetical protein